MESLILVQLKSSEAQVAQLVALQSLFARACNNLAPLVSQSRCWNRVALHHLAYKGLRERHPQLGSQMVCNVIYSVCRAARLVYQHPQSPWNVARTGQASLPVIAFSDDTPVFFDRHTLSIKKGQVSLFTLDGRMRFELGLAEADEMRFRQEKLREISLEKRGGSYFLRFILIASAETAKDQSGQAEGGGEPALGSAIDSDALDASAQAISAAQARRLDLPSYLVVHTEPPLPASPDLAIPMPQEAGQAQRLRA
jgi:hypothetical protein